MTFEKDRRKVLDQIAQDYPEQLAAGQSAGGQIAHDYASHGTAPGLLAPAAFRQARHLAEVRGDISETASVAEVRAVEIGIKTVLSEASRRGGGGAEA